MIRLQDHWKPPVDSLARGHVTRAFCPGPDLAVLLEQEFLVLNGQTVDADVHVGRPTPPLHVRLVGVHTPTRDGFFRTKLPPRLGARQAVARRIKLATSVHCLDQVDAARACSVTTLLHASLIASIIAALLAHTHTKSMRWTRPCTEWLR